MKKLILILIAICVVYFTCNYLRESNKEVEEGHFLGAGGTVKEITTPRGKVNLTGKWKMEFDFLKSNCERYKKLRAINVYDINITQTGYKIDARGKKVGEYQLGKFYPYGDTLIYRFTGTVGEDSIFCKSHEQNRKFKEMTGKFNMPIGENALEFEGDFIPNGTNCAGTIRLHSME